MSKLDANPYEDIIHLPHHVSATHPQMSLENRAAQFAPFAALTGYNDAVEETARLTETEADLTEDRFRVLNEKMMMLQASLKDRPLVSITYFRPDDRKSGGAYRTVEGVVKKIDVIGRAIVMEDGMEIPTEHILDIDDIMVP